jgi:sugar lactone lactonase YvrE
MLGLTLLIGPHRGARVLVCVLLAGSLLAACKHSNTTMMNTQGLWIANGTDVLEYIPSQLPAGTSAAVPHIMLKSAALGTPQGVTFDKAGNLWVMDPGGKVSGATTPALFEFSAAQLAALMTNSAPDPVATITATSFAVPQQSVFDANGNLWVSDHDANLVMVFSASQLAMQGVNPTVPVVTISSAAFNGPLGIALDAAGDLWVSNNGGVMGANNVASPAGTTIVEFAVGHLPTVPTSGMLTPDLTPDVVLSDDGKGSIQAPWGLVFDSMGNLWSNNANAPFTVVEFAKANLAMTGAPMPAVTISPAMAGGTPTLDAPNGLCFDSVGDLATTDSADAFGLAVFAKSQLMTGMPVPNTFIVGTATTLDAPAGCNFGPMVN